jgi:hypothetical protein
MQKQRGTLIYCLLFFQFVIHLIGELIQEQRSICVLMFLCFLLIKSGGLSSCWYGRSEAYFGKDSAAEQHASCLLNKEEFD